MNFPSPPIHSPVPAAERVRRMGAALGDFQVGAERAFGGVPGLMRLLAQVFALLRAALERLAVGDLASAVVVDGVAVSGADLSALGVGDSARPMRARGLRVVRAQSEAASDSVDLGSGAGMPGFRVPVPVGDRPADFPSDEDFVVGGRLDAARAARFAKKWFDARRKRMSISLRYQNKYPLIQAKSRRAANGRKFFGSFFQKRTASLHVRRASFKASATRNASSSACVPFRRGSHWVW